MATPGPTSQVTSAPSTAASGQATVVVAAAPAAPEAASVSLWPFVGVAFVALVLAVLWKKNGGLRFLSKPKGAPPPAGPVLHRVHRDLPDRRA